VKLKYLILRFIRHWLPDSAAHFLLHHRLIIKPGYETSNPSAAVEIYLKILNEHSVSLAGRHVLIFGYGGRFGVGCGLLEAGAGSVTLSDRFAPPDDAENTALLDLYPELVTKLPDGRILPAVDKLRLSNTDICEEARRTAAPLYDLVLSNSVFEHLDDVDGITAALASLTLPGGLHIHNIDLRDHYFKYPFEMLTFSQKTWEKWLNPGSNLNRLRVQHYRAIFERYFEDVKIEILARELEAFRTTRSRIKPEFLTGDELLDSVSLMRVTARKPAGTD